MCCKNLVDCHVHCDYSDDCTMQARGGIQRAIELGLHGITFTDHVDFDYPNPAYNFIFDANDRKRDFTELQNEFGDAIKIINGIEIGIQPQVIEQSKQFIATGNFDCIICSVHAVDGSSLCSQGTFFEGKTKEESYRRYLEAIYDSITQFTDYDIVGHIGYIRRYGPFSGSSLVYHDYADILDAILKTVIANGKAIEINTSGYAYKLGSPIPDLDLLVRYRELGGQLVTIGSDAHSKERVGGNFTEAVAILQQAGFSQVVYYHERKPIVISLT